MRSLFSPVTRITLPALFLASSLALGALPASDAAAPGSATSDAGWPRQFSSGGTLLTVYQPQLDAWDGRSLQAHAAVSVRPAETKESIFGIIWISARTEVDKESRLVDLEKVELPKATFPSAPASEGLYLDLFRREVPKWSKPIALDRLESSLAILEERRKGAALPLRNDPPRILFSNVPAILVSIDGPPAYRRVEGTRLERVLNTRPLILRDSSGTHYLHLFDGWMKAASLEGPWSVAHDPPPELAKARQQLTRSGQPVDLLEGEVPQTTSATAAPPSASAPSRPSLAAGPVPAIFVATSPAELIVTEGEPNWVPIEGTRLLYVRNTTGNVFKDLSDQKTYLLISGRWYCASSENGPWEYVSGRTLPEEFAKIPDDSPKENVKASIPSTTQAAEALIADEIPQTAKVDRRTTKMAPPEYDGEPKLAPIRGTSLQYVVNASLPVILVDGRTWYAVENGVWFVADSPHGPWAVADKVPPAIYSIPPDSPLHYVTYVRVYDASDDFVWDGYTPGYTGTCIDDDGLIVYGTGYPYPPWTGSVWYGAPVTWGLGFGLAWTPWWGWSFDVGFGWGWGWSGGGWVWGCLPPPWWGPIGWGWRPGGWYWRDGPRATRVVPWRTGGWAGASGSIYRRWGGTVRVSPRPVPAATPGTRHPIGVYGRSYNSRTGTLAAGQRAAVRSVYPQPRGLPPRVTGRPGNDVYAGPDQRVYRRDETGNWRQVAPRDARPPDREKIRPLERERGARETGEQRSRAARPPSPPPPRAAPPRAAPPRAAPAKPVSPRGGDRHR
jgi:hypothetical protein